LENPSATRKELDFMRHRHEQITIREAVGLFNNMEDLQDAVSDLEVQTFPREYFSVMGSRHDIKDKFGTSTISPEDVEDSPVMPRQFLVRREEKAIGAGALIGGGAYVGAAGAALVASAISLSSILPAVITGSLIGGVFGWVLVKVLSEHFDKSIEAQIRKGGLLLWVKTPDSQHEHIACRVLRDHGAKHVRIHEIAY
jgi:hypothetical protein